MKRRCCNAVLFLALLVCASDALATFGESPVFAFDTRANDGLSSFARSGTFVLDTRGGGAVSRLTIVGAASVAAAFYRVQVE